MRRILIWYDFIRLRQRLQVSKHAMHRHRRQITVASAWCFRRLEAALSGRQTAFSDRAMRFTALCNHAWASRPAQSSTLRRSDGNPSDNTVFGSHCRSRWLHSDKAQSRAPAPSRQQQLFSRSLIQQPATILRGCDPPLPIPCLVLLSTLTKIKLPMPYRWQPAPARLLLKTALVLCRTRQLSPDDTSTHASLIPTVGDIAPGSIVEFSVRGKPAAGLVIKRDGKKNWIIVDAR